MRNSSSFPLFNPSLPLPNIYGVIGCRFYVDSVPIRVYKNKVGVPYPNKGPMLLYATLYDGDSWATDGGQTKMNWSSGPFVASYTNFFVDACQWCNESSSLLVPSLCSLLQSTLWWDGVNYQTLNASDQVQLHNIRSKHLIYDYCADTNRYPIIPQDCLPWSDILVNPLHGWLLFPHLKVNIL
jgi:xyloglucan:xyloglucosyl transferase